MILHDTGDPNAPITDAYLLYHALKDNGVIVKFIAIPVAGHFLNDSPVRESDIYHYWIDWLDHYFEVVSPHQGCDAGRSLAILL